MVDRIDLRTLNLDELNGVVNLYPWFAGARKELCRRMAELGEGAWSDERYADAALYVASRRIIGELARKGHAADYSDKDIHGILDAYMSSGDAQEKQGDSRRVVVVGGDYFSQDQYDRVKRSDDNVFSSFAAKAREDGDDAAAPYIPQEGSDFIDLCTETLARIYEEQGYGEQAADIYSRLSLRYPEKSVYFASLIEKLKK